VLGLSEEDCAALRQYPQGLQKHTLMKLRAGAAAAGGADVLERVTKSLEKLQEHMLDIKSLQLKAASETRHASSISELDLALVEGVLRIQWALEGDTDVAAADLADESDFNWDTVHEAKQKHDYMEQLEKLVRGSTCCLWSACILAAAL
jgi:hypothetical protein